MAVTSMPSMGEESSLQAPVERSSRCNPVSAPTSNSPGRDGWLDSDHTWLPLYNPVPVDMRASVSPLSALLHRDRPLLPM